MNPNRRAAHVQTRAAPMYDAPEKYDAPGARRSAGLGAAARWYTVRNRSLGDVWFRAEFTGPITKVVGSGRDTRLVADGFGIESTVDGTDYLTFRAEGEPMPRKTEAEGYSADFINEQLQTYAAPADGGGPDPPDADTQAAGILSSPLAIVAGVGLFGGALVQLIRTR